MAPVHAPVPGRGIAISIIKPAASIFPTSLLFLSVWFSILSAIPLSFLVDFIHLITRFIKISMNGTGSIFPRTLRMKERCQSSPKAAPTGIAPLSSTKGSAEIKKTQRIFLNKVTVKDEYQNCGASPTFTVRRGIVFLRRIIRSYRLF